jgi:hypothetical protein
MSEWWTYRPSDFLLFSPRTYYRLFELYNAELWPAQVLTLGLGLALWLALWQGRAWALRAACALHGAAWLWVAWAFHWQRFASIDWAATWYAAAFALQGTLLCAVAAIGNGDHGAEPRRRTRALGLALLLMALVAPPALGVLLGRPWQQAEVFGLAPDPTVLATLGLLLLLRARRAPGRLVWLAWPLPLLWCLVTGTTLATMHAADAPLMPAAALLAAAAAWRDARTVSARP